MTRADRRTVVVHVTESLGAGTASAISDYVDATPEIEHHLIAASREGVPAAYRARFRSVVDVDRSITGIRTARRHVRALGPDVVHLHSSWAGVGYRVFPRVPGPTVLYTPHCFAFERRDVPRLVRAVFFVAEWLLRHRTDGLVACARREEALARRLGYDRTCYVPNRAGVAAPSEQSPADVVSTDPVATVVGVGRLSAQKDPIHFAAVTRAAGTRTGAPTRVRWVGDGSPALREELESAGVEVTGWLGREQVLDQLSSATVVLHTASWEGFPVLLLEAHELGLPMLVRRIAAFDHLPDELLGASVEELADKLRRLLDDPDARAENVSRWRTVLQEHTLDHQAERLRLAYASGSAA